MTFAVCFWILILLWVVSGLIYGWRGPEGRWPLIGSWIIPLLLLGLLGWVVFGPALHR